MDGSGGEQKLGVGWCRARPRSTLQVDWSVVLQREDEGACDVHLTTGIFENALT